MPETAGSHLILLTVPASTAALVSGVPPDTGGVDPRDSHTVKGRVGQAHTVYRHVVVFRGIR